MSTTIIEATKTSPRVELNPYGKFILEGRSIVEDTVTFYQPIIDWVEKAACEEMNVEIRMEYLNTSSTRQLLALLKAVAANPHFSSVNVKWYYEEDDEDILDLGKDYESLIHIPFEFQVTSEN
jgi:hypothetical protein